MGNLKITIRSSATEERTVEVPIPSSRPLGGNTEVREFLALRARERKAAARSRRIKRTCLALGAATAVAAFVVPKFRARARTAVAATAPASTEAPAALATPAAAISGPQLAPAASFDEPVSLGAVAPAPLAAEPQPADAGSCLQDFDDQRWRAAVESCTLAFEASNQATLALKVAHAHWARGDVRLSGDWAEKAVALGTTDADAYVLIGHARRRAGHADEAIDAYRQYLRASPRGWHARTVRAALRRLRPAPADQPQEPEQATAEAEPTAQSLLQ